MTGGFWRKIGRSFLPALAGCRHLLAGELNARVHFVAAIAVVAAGLALGVDRLEWCVLALSIAAVVGAEAANSALEKLADAVHPEHHPLVGKAKDLAAAGVTIVAAGALVCGALIFIPRIWKLFAVD